MAISSRAGAAAVALTAAVTLVMTTGTWASAEGDTETLSACVLESSGSVRLLLDDDATCRNGERLVTWESRDGDDVDVLALLGQDDGVLNQDDDPVHWTKLRGVPQSVTGDSGLGAFIEALAAPATSTSAAHVHWTNLTDVPQDLADGDVAFSELSGSLTTQMLAGLVTGEVITDGSVQTVDLAGEYTGDAETTPGAVTSAKIKDSTIEGRDLAADAVTPEHLALQYGSTFNYPISPIAGVDLGGATVSGAGTYAVAGHVQLQFTGTSNDFGHVQYQIVRVGNGAVAGVSEVYTQSLTAYDDREVASLSTFDHRVGDGTHTYYLRVSAPTFVAVSTPMVMAHELG